MVTQVEREHDARSEIVTVREAARDDEHRIVSQALLSGDELVDVDDFRPSPSQIARVSRVLIAIGARCMKDKNGGLNHLFRTPLLNSPWWSALHCLLHARRVPDRKRPC